jgi:hypothetical protein
MNVFDIFIGYVSWGGDGKRRPVLILKQEVHGITVFNITSRYENKSAIVQSKYFKINDWQQAGLNKQSYVDTNDTITLPPSSVDTDNQIGKLTDSDVEKFIKFLTKEEQQ